MVRHCFIYSAVTTTCAVISFSTALQAVTWNELRSSATTNILPLRSAELSVEKAEAEAAEAKAGFFPTLKATGSVSRAIEPEPTGSVTNNRLGITASQNLFAGFSDQKKAASADAARNSVVASRSAQSVEQRSVLRKIFNNGLYQQHLLELSKKIVARREQNVRIVNLRYSSGLENKSSYLKTQASQLKAEADRDYTAAKYLTAKIEAGRRSGRTVTDSEVFEGTLATEPVSTTPNAIHPSIVKAQSDRDAASSTVDVARAGWLPQITADASAFQGGTNLKLEPERRYEVGLTLTVPLFTPNQSPRYRQSTADLAKAEIALAQTQLDFDLALRTAQTVVDDAKRRVAVATKTFEATEMQAEVYRKRYTLGLISFQDWDAAETDFIDANREYLLTQQKLADAIADLDAAIGRKLEDEGP